MIYDEHKAKGFVTLASGRRLEDATQCSSIVIADNERKLAVCDSVASFACAENVEVFADAS